MHGEKRLRSWIIQALSFCLFCICPVAQAQIPENTESEITPLAESEETVEAVEAQLVRVRNKRRQLSANREAMRQNMTTGVVQMQRQRQELIREDEQLAALFAEATELESRLLAVRQQMVEILEQHPALVEQNQARAAASDSYNQIAARERELADMEYNLVVRLAQLRREKDPSEPAERSP